MTVGECVSASVCESVMSVCLCVGEKEREKRLSDPFSKLRWAVRAELTLIPRHPKLSFQGSLYYVLVARVQRQPGKMCLYCSDLMAL